MTKTYMLLNDECGMHTLCGSQTLKSNPGRATKIETLNV